MKLALFVTAGALSLAAVLPYAALADSVTYESGPASSTTTETTTVASPSTTVVREQPVYVAPTEQNTTIVDKRKKHHLISLPFVKVF